MRKRRAIFLVLTLSLGAVSGAAQDRLKSMPGHARYEKMSAEIPSAVKLGALTVTWSSDGKTFTYAKDGKLYRYDIAARRAVEAGTAPAEAPRRGRPGAGPVRGRQWDSALSPDKKLKAFHRDRNLWLSDADGKNAFAVTEDGAVKTRVKSGTASWVYGEELDQATAIWWSPDSQKIAFYRFDESRVPDFFLQIDQTKLYSAPDIEAYPKAGEPNPVVDVLIYDVASRKTVRADVRDGKAFDDAVVGHYVYNVGWSPDGSALLFNRTNRRQNVLELAACDPATGACRVVVRDGWPTGWVENNPEMRFLADGRRFIRLSERTGWKNYYLHDLDGSLLRPLTNHAFEVAGIVHVDEKAGLLYYRARSGDNPMKVQLHRVGLDGRRDRRLTDPAFHHTITMAPNGKHFVDVAQTHDAAPVTRLMDAGGRPVAVLATSDLTKFDALGLKKPEIFTFKAADGVTDLYGLLSFPSNFDPCRKYPLLVNVYAGPGTNGSNESFLTSAPLTEFGFLVASFDTRGAGGRGRKALDAVYMRLGIVEMDDQAAGVKALWDRPYMDRARVGIFGTSYGGYTAAMCLLRHPEVFRAACASSPLSGWEHYDSIYTERYMWIPRENGKGYAAGNAMTYADKLDGRLMIYYGTADNNVHPNNSMQLIQALQKAGKSFEVQVGPDAGHSSLNRDRMMEFFIENLVMNAPPAARSAVGPGPSRDPLSERIERIETGLLKKVRIEGRPYERMTLAERMAAHKVPALSVAVIRDSKIEWAKAYGVQDKEAGTAATTETLFQAASISKAVAAGAALRLVEQGLPDLDADVNGTLASWKVPESPFTKDAKVTLRRILSHSAGLTVHGFEGYAGGKPVPTLLQVLNGDKPANSAPIRVDILPGSQWRYSGGGYTVMQQMMMDAARKPFPDIMRELVLAPAGMRSSTYEQPIPSERLARAAVGYRADGAAIDGKRNVYPEMAAAGLWTTPSDLCRYAIAVMNALDGRPDALLSKDMVRRMLTVEKTPSGLGVFLSGEGESLSFGHGGANEGFRCDFVAFPAKGIGAAIMTNSDAGGSLVDELGRAIAAEYGLPGFDAVVKSLADLDARTLDRYQGRYEIDFDGQTVPVLVSLTGDHLRIKFRGGDWELYPESETKFFTMDAALAVTFIVDGEGRATGFVVNETMTAKKV
jgi:dipeptidyl-peptidase-4